MRRRSEPDEGVRVQITDSSGERRAVVAVVLVGEDDEIDSLGEVAVQVLAETFLELVDLAALFVLRPD